jgi:hypothetical protein
MKTSLFVIVFCAAVLAAAGSVKADGVPTNDPKMVPLTGNAGGCGSTPITLLPFTFMVDSSGDSTTTGECFSNTSGVPINSLQVTTSLPAVQNNPCNSTLYDFTESGDLFANDSCNFNSQTKLLTVTFFGTGGNFPGVPVKTDFFMDMAGWSSDQSFVGLANPPLPEPGSALLLSVGLAALVAVRPRKSAV